MATHASILAWIIPRTEEPGGLQTRMSGEHARTPHIETTGSCHWCLLFKDLPRQRLTHSLHPSPSLPLSHLPLSPLPAPSLPSSLSPPPLHEAWHIRGS